LVSTFGSISLSTSILGECLRLTIVFRIILLAEGYDADDELDMVTNHRYQLSQKDHWENNGVLDDILTWSEEGRDAILWVGGSSENQDSWFTEFSTDIIIALQPQLVTVLFVLCKERGRQPLTPLTLIRRLLVQLLELHPELAYQHPEFCNLSQFQKSVSFGQTWRLFEALTSELQNLFIVIDRVEEFQADDNADVIHHLLPRLIDFGTRYEAVSVIVTSIFNPPDEVVQLPMYASYIDTSKRENRRME
jgi:hypothetical protein